MPSINPIVFFRFTLAFMFLAFTFFFAAANGARLKEISEIDVVGLGARRNHHAASIIVGIGKGSRHGR